MTFFVGLTTTALSGFEPMTAPTPERAASRPRSFAIPAMIERPSPAGPIRAMLAVQIQPLHLLQQAHALHVAGKQQHVPLVQLLAGFHRADHLITA